MSAHVIVQHPSRIESPPYSNAGTVSLETSYLFSSSAMKKHILSLKKVSVSREGTKLLHAVSLDMHTGEVHMIMGPNGSGKSTLLHTIMGDSTCILEGGSIAFHGKRIHALGASSRARLGIFLTFQNPVTLAGVPFAHVIQAGRESMPHRFPKSERHLSPAAVAEKMRTLMDHVELDTQFIYRSLNEGFSGGEKKKAELIQLVLLNPSLALIDEIDSGLDIDALRAVSAVIDGLRRKGMTLLIVTHNPQLAEYIKPNWVHIFIGGRIVRSGTAALARTIAEKGYEVLAT